MTSPTNPAPLPDDAVAGSITAPELPDAPFLKVIRGDLRYEGPTKRTGCQHGAGFWVDDLAGQVVCRECEEPVSLMVFANVMMAFSDRIERFRQRALRERRLALVEQLRALKSRRALSEDDRAQIQRASWNYTYMPIEELVALRDAIEKKATGR